MFYFSSLCRYDVKFQNGQECGGAYIKLLSRSPDLNLVRNMIFDHGGECLCIPCTRYNFDVFRRISKTKLRTVSCSVQINAG